jgi:hypothetical protein
VLLACACASGFVFAHRPQQASGSTTSTPKSTSAKRKSTSKKHHATKREPTQKVPTPDRITEIQSALAHNGYYQGTPSGKWDATTVAAMQKFQSANGLDPSGKLDALSLQKLGLGSSVAGVSAPRPPTPPSAVPSAAPAGQPGKPSAGGMGAGTQTASNAAPSGSTSANVAPAPNADRAAPSAKPQR